MKNYVLQTYRLALQRPAYAGKMLRIAFFSDLHGCCDSTETETVLSLLQRAEPDLVLCGGDIITAYSDCELEPALRFLEQVAKQQRLVVAPGNHEMRLRLYPETYGGRYQAMCEGLAHAGICYLENQSLDLRLQDIPVHVYGYELPRAYYQRFRCFQLPLDEIDMVLSSPDPDGLSVLLAHNPAFLDTYFSWGADLTLCGHTHGGIWRFGAHRGLFSPEGKLFSKLNYGHFQKGQKHAIISAGCGEHTLPVRIRNPREIVLVQLTMKA